jgi:hypothetical protein
MVKTLWWRERLRPTILTRRLPSTEHSSNFPVCGSPILPRRWKVMGCWPSSWALRTMPQLFGPGHCQQWGSDPRPGRFGCRAIVHGRRCSLQVPRYRGPDARGHLHPLPFDLFSESNECVRSGWRFDSCGRDSRCGPATVKPSSPRTSSGYFRWHAATTMSKGSALTSRDCIRRLRKFRLLKQSVCYRT